MASQFGIGCIICICLRMEEQLCKERVLNRSSHPTIQDGECGVAIIEHFSRKLVWPVIDEGFRAIIDVHHPEEIDCLLQKLEVSEGFPLADNTTTNKLVLFEPSNSRRQPLSSQSSLN